MTGIFKIKCLHQGTVSYLQQSLWAETEANNPGAFLLPTKCTSFCLLWFKPFIIDPYILSLILFLCQSWSVVPVFLSLFSHSFLSWSPPYSHSVLFFLSFSLLFPALLVHCSVPPAGSLKMWLGMYPKWQSQIVQYFCYFVSHGLGYVSFKTKFSRKLCPLVVTGTNNMFCAGRINQNNGNRT